MDMTTLSKPNEKGELGAAIPDTYYTEEATNAIQKSRPRLADDFLLWYAQRKPWHKWEPEPWAESESHWEVRVVSDPEDKAWMWMSGSAEATNERHSSRASKSEVITNPIENLLTPSSNSVKDCEDWGQFDYYYDCDKDFKPTKIMTRKWKFSTPPALRHVSENHVQRLASRTKARTTIRQEYDISWADGATTWVIDSPSNLLNDSSYKTQASDFETSFSDRTWGEIQLAEIDPTFKKYRTYRPTLLRWCCTGS